MTSQTPLAEGRHNHPPRCCCPGLPARVEDDHQPCPVCPEHGGLAEPEYPCCHQLIGRPHTDYCQGDTCPKCLGDKQVANTDDAEPWSCWAKLPHQSALAVRMGLVQPITCPECKGTGTTA